jgi:predicted enzyme related to lactoylglutathione lyase
MPQQLGTLPMTQPNTLVFIDWPSTDAAAAGDFYAAVLGWDHDRRIYGSFARLVPGGKARNPDGSLSEVNNLHLGIYQEDKPAPSPQIEVNADRPINGGGANARIFVMVSPDDSVDRILGEAEARGAKILWRNHHWKEFKGVCHSFRDPWGTQIVLWNYVAPDAVLPDHFTSDEAEPR